ncbi:hypothetical protein [Streptomyces afghaniensis]|uniref:hypothetical protein n=1 Tax=Streptomyces afghaniensis TaxID=66865 RepID=UPI00277E5553|nr:hypothetical protein [Streptomyces afghaniensis]MDQ1016708.1 hypothetical protein [Streptomyces afghaniensis]
MGIEQPYGRAFAAILDEMAKELERSKRVEGRTHRRMSNARIGAWRQSLLFILEKDHGMDQQQAEAALLNSVRHWKWKVEGQ